MQKRSTEDFILQATVIHGNRYNYSRVNFQTMASAVAILCPDHGLFNQKPRDHLSGCGCPVCGRLARGLSRRGTKEDFVKQAKVVHSDKYDYSLSSYGRKDVPITIICREHGVFYQRPDSHLRGQGCPKCGNLKQGISKRLSSTEFVERANRVHNSKYSYTLVSYTTAFNPVDIVCPEHGIFKQQPLSHLYGSGCPICGKGKAGLSRRVTQETFIAKAVLVHENKYDYSKTIYRTMEDTVDIICKKHGIFTQKAASHLHGCGCPKCVHLISSGEIEISDWLESEGYAVVRGSFNIIKPKQLDIFLPEYKLAIEFNGLYFHSSRINDNPNYHLEKQRFCEDKGIRLIQIWDCEWREKKEICKEIILFALWRIHRKIYARKCKVQEISVSDANTFLDANHIQGGCSANYRLGLYYEKELVGVQCYQSPNTGGTSGNSWLIARTAFLRGIQVIGGLSKMFKVFLSNKNPDVVVDYTDRRLFMASGHHQMGFFRETVTKPCSHLTDCRNIYSRRHYRHQGNLHFKFKMPWDNKLSDTENLARNGWFWVWDCGKIKNVWRRTI